MKKLIGVLTILVILMLVVPVSAGTKEIVGDLWRPWLELPAANEPFHTKIGWAWALPDDVPPGLLDMQLKVDGVYVEEAYILRKPDTPHTGGHPNWWWFWNFPEGLAAGWHRITFEIYGPCKIFQDLGSYIGPCEKRNEIVLANNVWSGWDQFYFFE